MAEKHISRELCRAFCYHEHAYVRSTAFTAHHSFIIAKRKNGRTWSERFLAQEIIEAELGSVIDDDDSHHARNWIPCHKPEGRSAIKLHVSLNTATQNASLKHTRVFR